MSVKLTSRQVGDVTVVDAVGRITLGEGASAFRDRIRELVNKGSNKVLLNLGEVSYIDSSGIGEMVSGFTTVTNSGGQLKLLGLSKRAGEVHVCFFDIGPFARGSPNPRPPRRWTELFQSLSDFYPPPERAPICCFSYASMPTLCRHCRASSRSFAPGRRNQPSRP